MKQGRTITELAQEIERQSKTKKDYLANGKAMYMSFDTSNKPVMSLGGELQKSFRIKPLAHRQIGQKLNIPAKYYDKMLAEDQGLLSANVNTWLLKTDEKRLVRTLDGKMRALLSKGYRPLDNHDLAEAVLPLFDGLGLNMLSCEVTEDRFYLKATTPRMYAEVEKDDIVQSGICISNSEVGLGRLSVEPLVYRLVCLNGMIINDYGIRKNHVGRRSVDSRDVSEFYRDETKQQDDKAFWMKVQDVVQATLDEVKFATIVNTLKDSTKRQITGDVLPICEKVAGKYNMSENEQGSVLKHLIDGGSLTQYALGNAITRMSHSVESYDRATDYERAGSDIIQLKPAEWRVLNG